MSGDKIPETFQLSHPIDALNNHVRRGSVQSEQSFEISSEKLYLEYRNSGYISSRNSSRTIPEFYDEIRAFYGICMAHNIISRFPYGDSITPYLIVNMISGNIESIVHAERAEDDIVDCANLATSTDIDDSIENGVPIEELLNIVRQVFSCTESARLKTAATWLLKAHLSKKGLDKILESAIAIEVLMGDRDTSDRLGLTKLVANRCAYALGKSSEEREKIIEDFIKFYRMRSEIVHSGRTTLHGDEKQVVVEGINLASRILKHEIQLAV